jgi:hypothetical protein
MDKLSRAIIEDHAMAATRGGGSRCGRLLGGGLLLALFIGCGGAPKVHPVKGKVVFEKGDIKLLSGSTLICQQKEEPYFQAHGDIGDDGSFSLTTNSKGEVLPGAAEGTYRAWIQLSTENGNRERQFKKIGIDPGFLDGKSSSLSFKVPAEKEIVLTVTRARPGATLIAPDTPAVGVRCGETEQDSDAPGGADAFRP